MTRPRPVWLFLPSLVAIHSLVSEKNVDKQKYVPVIEYCITANSPYNRHFAFHFAHDIVLVLVWTTQVSLRTRQQHVTSSCKNLRHNYANISIIISDIKNQALS